MLKSERSFYNTKYRFSFNGQEKVDEINGSGNHNTALFWEYNSRLIRRWNLDPKPTIGLSEYSVFMGNPIWNYDLFGDTPTVANRVFGGLRAIGGAAEMTIGAVGGAATSWTGIGGVLGGAAVVHGADQTSTGLTQLLTGEETQSNTEKVISTGLQAAGLSQDKANSAASWTDAGLSLILSAGSASTTMASDATRVASSPVLKVVKTEEVLVQQEAKSYSIATYQSFENQLAKNGVKSILKSQANIQKNLAEETAALAQYKAAGGYTSSVEREIKTFQSQLDAISDLLKNQK